VSRRNRAAAPRGTSAARRSTRPGQPARASRPSPLALASIGALVAGVALVGVMMILSAPWSREPAGRVSRASAPPLIQPVEPSAVVPAGLVDGQAVGRPDAPVVMEVYGDFQCPVCGRFAREYLPRLVDEFVRDGALRIVDRPIAFLGTGRPDESVDAAVGATCAARQDRYWSYHDLLFANQAGENRGAFAWDRLRQMATSAGLDLSVYDGCVAEAAVAEAVRAATGHASEIGVNSTPTFVINGQKVVGLVPYDQLAAMIRAGTA
jgi:protein-disulfide isomerase